MSIKSYARLAGFLYTINIVFGFFAIGYMPGVVITNEAASTANNMIAHEQMFRLAFAAHLVILLTNIPLGMIFWKMFNKVSREVALMILFFSLVGTAVEAANLLNQYMSLITLTTKSAMAPEQLESLSYLFNRLQVKGVHVSFVFFGFFLLCQGYCVIKSTFIPKIFGVFMLLGGTCYIIYSFSSLTAPVFAESLVPYILIPSGLSELAFTIWLLIAGVRMTKWKERFGTAEG